MSEFAFKCRCGAELQVEKLPDGSVVTVFCEDCYLNHRIVWVEGKPKITHQFYFPDD